jgi:2-hydroxychromene-2-carboxylate isomerase
MARPRLVDRYMTLPLKFAEMPLDSGSVVSAVTFADFEPGGGGVWPLAEAGASAAASAASPIAVVRTLRVIPADTQNTPSDPSARQALFFYDLGSPYAWLSAERIDSLFAVPPVWVPVLLGGVFKATGRGSWAETDARADGIAEIERRASERGLPSPVWPSPWPNNGLYAMRVAAALDSRDFALTAFRMHFTEGLPLSEPEHVDEAARRAGFEPRIDKDRLRANTDRALSLGVFGVPTVVVGDEAFWGDDRLESALQQELQ